LQGLVGHWLGKGALHQI
jgi:hypothetical protein